MSSSAVHDPAVLDSSAVLALMLDEPGGAAVTADRIWAGAAEAAGARVLLIR